MLTSLKNRVPSIVLAVVVLALAMAVSATAATLITSADIKDDTVASIDVKDGTLKVGDLSAAGRGAFIGSLCKVPPNATAGVVTMKVGGDHSITLTCKLPATADGDGDGFSKAAGDCNDTDNEVHPGAQEIFDGKDDNCDGLLLEQDFYTGPPGTQNIGICQAGHKIETIDPPDFFEVTVPEQTPIPEIPGNTLDDDCDGVTDEVS